MTVGRSNTVCSNRPLYVEVEVAVGCVRWIRTTVNGRSIIGQLERPSTVEMARFQEPHGGETRTVGKLRLRRIRWQYYLAFDLQKDLVAS